VKGVALTLEKYAGCKVSIKTIAEAKIATKRLRIAIRLATEPLSEIKTLIKFGLDLTIIGENSE
jgi:hypothetical protein